MQTNRRRVRGQSLAKKTNSAVIETLEQRTLMTVFTVTSTGDGGVPGDGSLRSAINASNADTAQTNTIAFNLGAGVQTIGVVTNLPDTTQPVNIDGTTEPGYAGSPLVVLDGALNLPAELYFPTGLDFIKGAQGSSVRGLEIVDFATYDLHIGADNMVIAGNYIGTDGTSPASVKSAYGIAADDAGLGIHHAPAGLLIGGKHPF